MTGQTLVVPGMSAVSSVYKYDGANRIAKAMESPATPIGSTCAATSSQWCRFFGYGAGGNGNRVVADQTGQGLPLDTPAGYDANNRIADTVDGTVGGTPAWLYDSRGNVVKQGTGETFAYDGENRQVAYCPNDANPASCVQTAGNNRTLYSYDGEGHRVMVSGPGGTTTFVYDAAGSLAAEYGATAAVSGCVTCYLTTDHLGSTRVVTDQAGCAVYRQDYLTFGEAVLVSTGNPRMSAGGGPNCTGTNGYTSGAGSPVRVQFTGQPADSESNLYFYGARYYSAAAGRFLSPDGPFNDQNAGDPQSWNMYSYVLNNPLKFIDPTGMACTYQGADNGGAADYADPTNYIDDNNGGQSCAQAFASPPQQVDVTDNNSWLNNLSFSSWWNSGSSQGISQERTPQDFSLSGPEMARQRADAKARCVNGLIGQAALRGVQSFTGVPLGDDVSLGDFAGLAKDAARSPGAAVATAYAAKSIALNFLTKRGAARVATLVGSEIIPVAGQVAAVVAVGWAAWDGVSWYRDQLNNGACGR